MHVTLYSHNNWQGRHAQDYHWNFGHPSEGIVPFFEDANSNFQVSIIKGDLKWCNLPTIAPMLVWVEEWVQELALQRQISKMVQEKTHYVQELFKEQVKLQLLEAQMDDIQSKLAAVCVCFLLMIQH